MKKRLLILLALMLLFVAGCGSSEGEEEAQEPTGRVVYVYNYGDYIDPECIELFEEETGITVVYDVYDTNEEMYPVLASGAVRYDVVCPSEYMVQKLLANDMLAEINYDNVPNFEYISQVCRNIAEQYDPGNRYSVPYAWGTVGIMYNTKIYPSGSITRWSDLWKEEYFDDIMMMDSLRDIYMVPLKILGYSANSTDPDELREATDLLIEQKSLVYKYANDAIRDFLLSESAGIGMIYSGEVGFCLDEVDFLEYVLPEEGSNVWVDSWVIPKNCRDKEAAEAWIDFFCRPEIGLMNFDYLFYSTPNDGTLALMAEDPEYEDILDNPAIVPSEESVSRCEVYRYLGPEADRLYNEFWKEFKAY